jgi:hypothetical protein
MVAAAVAGLVTPLPSALLLPRLLPKVPPVVWQQQLLGCLLLLAALLLGVCGLQMTHC